jgi:hypothetical protein
MGKMQEAVTCCRRLHDGAKLELNESPASVCEWL